MVCVVGDAFVDITIPIPLENIAYGGVNTTKINIECGGTANVAVWLSRLGIKSSFFGKVGNDAFGRIFKEDLKNEGVVDLTTVGDNLQTGICICIIDKSGERSMIVDRGANDYIELMDVNRYLHEISKADLIYFTGYSLISRVTSKSIEYLIREISGDKTVCFNPGSYNIIGNKHRDIIKNHCDMLILNLEEARELTKMKDIEFILEDLESLVDIVVLTMGGEGCIVSNKDKRIMIPALRVENVVDTTGAGDAFSAGFLKGFVERLGLEECARIGHKVASEVIRRFGAR